MIGHPGTRLLGALAAAATLIAAMAGSAQAEDGCKLEAFGAGTVAAVRDGRTLLDCRTLTDAEVDEVAAAVLALR